MCGSFTCSKNSLIALNILYVLVAILLIGVAGAAQYTAIVASLAVVSVIVACGVFLLMISIVGLAAAARHHQVMLFFYMIVLFIIFVIQFGVACACLAMNDDQQKTILEQGWRISNDDLKTEAQVVYHCCGFESVENTNITDMNHPSCFGVTNDSGEACCTAAAANDTCCPTAEDCHCGPCKDKLVSAVRQGFTAAGGVGLFFSFTEMLGFFLARAYRNQINPYLSAEESRLQ